MTQVLTKLSTSPAIAAPPLRSLAFRAAGWSALGYGTGQIIRLAGNLVMTRLLFPEAFGVMALVLVFIQGLTMFSDIGIGPSIIREPQLDRAFLRTAWTVQIIRGLLLWLIACAIAGPVAAFYDKPILATLMPIVGLSALIAGFNPTSLFTAQRDMKISRLTIVEIVSALLTIAVMITWALIHPTLWALAAGAVTGATTRVLLGHLLLPGAARSLLLDRDALRRLTGFGKWIFLSTAITFVSLQSDRLMLGRWINESQLGVYAIAMSLAILPRELINRLSSQVTFPAISRMIHSQHDVVRRVGQARQALRWAGIPVCALLAATGPLIVRLLYDARYHDAGLVLSILAAGTWLQVLSFSYGNVLLAAGVPKLISLGNFLRAVTFTSLALPMFNWFGTPGVAAVYGLAELAALPVYVWRAGKLGLATPARDALDTLGAVAVMGLMMLAAYAIDATGVHVVFTLIAPGLIALALLAAAARQLMRARAAVAS